MRFQLNRQHVLSALDLTINHYYSVQVIMSLAFVFIISLAIHHSSADKLFRMLFVTMIILVIYFLPTYLVARHRFIKMFTLPEFTGPIEVAIVNGELVAKTERSSSSVPRAWINKVKSNDRVTVLCRESVPCFIIPAEMMKEDESLRNYMENKPVQAS